MEAAAQPWPCSSYGNKIEFYGFYFKERQLQRSWGPVRICPALLKGLSSHRQDNVFPIPYKCSLFYHWILYSLRSMVFGWNMNLGPNSVLFFSGKNLTTLRSTGFMGELLQASSINLQQDGAPDHSTPQEPAPSTLAAHFCVAGVPAFGQEYLGPKAAHCQIQQSRGFYLQCHYFPFLCVCTVN